MGARLSWKGYADILAMLRTQPRSAPSIAAAINHNKSNMRLILRRMNALKLVHVSGWTPKAWHTVPSPIYAEGDGYNVPAPLTNHGEVSRHQAASHIRVPAGSNLVAFAEMVKAMKDAPIHRADLARVSGTNHDALCRLIRYMHDIRLIHVADWERGTSGIPKQLMAWGDFKDKPRLHRLVRPKTGEAQKRRRQLRVLQALAGVPWSPGAPARFIRRGTASNDSTAENAA